MREGGVDWNSTGGDGEGIIGEDGSGRMMERI